MYSPEIESIKIVNSIAPVRVGDNGGWTDTWFSGTGKIFNIAINPGAEVQIEVFSKHPSSPQNGGVILRVEDFNDLTYEIVKDKRGEHPMLEAAIKRIGAPDGIFMKVSVHSDVPYGSSTGSSAAICTALIAALAELSGRKMTKEEIVSEALKVEVDLGGQSGIQDQICSVFGKINLIRMDKYPDQYTVYQPEIAPEILLELQKRLLVITLGRHNSSNIHQMVIDNLKQKSEINDLEKEKLLIPLRNAAEKAMEAIEAGDFAALGQAFKENNQAQMNLHSKLVSPKAVELFKIADSFGALGWKVNGAGGLGGSITIICGQEMALKRKMINYMRECNRNNPHFFIIPHALNSQGLISWTRLPDQK